MEIRVYNQQGQEAGAITLPKAFELPWNADLVHQVVTSQAANLRRGTAHAKGRGEVRGGGRKPWRQKGTGRARHGSIRSPLWKGGGVTHGPRKEKSYKKKINRRMAQKALATVLAAKVRDHEVLILDDLSLAQPKTKDAVKLFSNLVRAEFFAGLVAKPRRALVLLPGTAPELRRALRNYQPVELAEARNVTARDVLNRKYIVAPRSSMDILAKRLSA